MKVMRKERLRTADRDYKLAAERAIRKDLVRALIELILNCDDSYRRLGIDDGCIDIHVKKKSGGGATISVRDAAEGMDPERLQAAVAEYGRAASGLYDGHGVRGYFGHGLKDAILGLGSGRVVTFKDDQVNIATLAFDGRGTPMITYYEPARATAKMRRAYGIEKNGTHVSVEVMPNVSIPQFERLREQLSRHYMLRRVMSDDRREVQLTYRAVVAGTDEARLVYREPVTVETVLDASLELSEDPAARILVKRATVPLDSPKNQPLADGGLLIGSATAIFDHELFRFDGADGAEYLFGEVTAPFLDDLLRRDEPILSATRDGLVWSHEPLRPLREAIERKLGDVIEAERRKRREEEEGVRSRELRRRMGQAVNELNRIAKLELTHVVGIGSGKDGRGTDPPPPPGEPIVPESGFGFIHEFTRVVLDKRASLLVRSRDSLVDAGSVVSFAISDDENFELHTPQAVLEPLDEYPSILEARVYLEGRRTGAECLVTAAVDECRSEAMCQVITKRPPPPPRTGGLINEIKFDPRPEPRTRVRFDKTTGNVFVATMSPSVALYIGPNGEKAEQDEGAVLLAELVLEAVCREIARRGVESATFIAPEGGETEAMQREFSRLQNQHGALIHQCFGGIASSAPTRRGRMTAREEAERAAVPV